MNAREFLKKLQPEDKDIHTQEDRIKYHFIASIILSANEGAELDSSQEHILRDRIELESLFNPNGDLAKVRVAMEIATWLNTCR